MTLSISATPTNKISYTLSSSNGNQIVSFSDSKSAAINYTYGSGNQQITNAATVTGVLNSGQTAEIDLYSINQTSFNTTNSIVFTGIKNLTIYNESVTQGDDFAIQATGANACTNLFNGGSGNLLVKPYSGFTYNDPYTGITISASQRYIQLADQGAGSSYKMIILGLD